LPVAVHLEGGAAVADRRRKHRGNRRGESGDFFLRQRARGRRRVDACGMQRLIGVDIADAGDPRLVQKHALHRAAGAG